MEGDEGCAAPTDGEDNGGLSRSWNENVGARPRDRLVGESSMDRGVRLGVVFAQLLCPALHPKVRSQFLRLWRHF